MTMGKQKTNKTKWICTLIGIGILIGCVAYFLPTASDPSESITHLSLAKSETASPAPIVSASPIPASVAIPDRDFFEYTPCKVDTIPGEDNTHAAASSGFTLIEQPDLPLLTNIIAISTGQYYDAAGYGMEMGTSYALTKDGDVYQWGYSFLNDALNSYPKKVEGIKDAIVQLSGRFALSEKGEVYELSQYPISRKLPELSGSTSISQAEESRVFALGVSGNVRGYDLIEPNGQAAVVWKKPEYGKVKSMAISSFRILFLREDGTLYIDQGNFGSATDSIKEVKLPNKEQVVYYTSTMSQQDSVYIQSDKNNWYRFNQENMLEKAKVPEGTVQIVAMDKTKFALLEDGTVWTWGADLRDPDYPQRMIEPKLVAGLSHITSLAASPYHLLALTEGGTVWSMGSNMYGQLGRSSVFEDQLSPYGNWSGLEALFSVSNALLAVRMGDIWSLEDDGTTEPILLGQKAKKAISALGSYVVLTEEGKLVITAPENASPCFIIERMATTVIDIESSFNGMVMATADGRAYYLEGILPLLDQLQELQLEPEPKGKITKVFGFPVPFVLTDQGELYYQAYYTDGVRAMKPVPLNVPIKQWSPITYFSSDGLPTLSGKVLDRNNQVYNIFVEQQQNNVDSDSLVTKVIVKKTNETGISLAGGAVIDSNGRIVEEVNNKTYISQVPSGNEIISTLSLYLYAKNGEGRSTWQHIFIAKDGTLYWQGDLPYNGLMVEPGLVRKLR